jgi:hypothetical protein
MAGRSLSEVSPEEIEAMSRSDLLALIAAQPDDEEEPAMAATQIREPGKGPRIERLPSKPEAAHEPTVEWVDMTPEMAAKLLEGNKDNRPLDQGRVNAYARDIRAGAWRITGDAVKLTNVGEIVDGQHRLWAVVEAGLTVRLLLVRGIDKAARVAIDRHRPRRDAEDLRALHGVETDPKRAVAIVKQLDVLVAKRTRYLTFEEVMQSWCAFEAEVVWAIGATSSAKHLRYTPVAAALAFARRASPEAIAAFTEKLRTGANLAEGDPALALRAYLVDRDRVRADGRRATTLRVLRAAQAELEGERLQLVRPTEECLEFFSRHYPHLGSPEKEQLREVPDHRKAFA